MKTLLIRPSLCIGSVMDMPLNILVLGSYIKRISDVIVWDFPIKYGIPLTKENYLKTFERFKDDLMSEEPDVVGVSCTSGDEYVPTLRVARAVKEVLPRATVIAGGYHASSCAEEMLMESKDLDCVVIGEGEESLRKIVQNRLEKKQILQDVPGILAFNGGSLFRTDPVCIDINKIPMIEAKLVEYPDAYPSIAVEFSRGCPFRCNFCQGPSIPDKRIWRARSPERAVMEVKYLADNFGTNYFFFYDPLFGANDAWTREICKEISQRSLDIKWFAMVRVALKKETLLMMREAGAYTLFYGLESGSQKILTLMDKVPGAKDYTDYLENAKQTIADSVELGIIPIIGMIIGYPGENRNTMEETRHYLKGVIKECRARASETAWGIDPMFYLPLPKSQGYERLETYKKEFGTKLIIDRWWKKDFPFFNYFRDKSAFPSTDVTLDDLEDQRRFLFGMSHYTEKSSKNSFWCYCHTNRRELQSLRRMAQSSGSYQVRNFSKSALAKWRIDREHKVSIGRRIRRMVLDVVHGKQKL